MNTIVYIDIQIAWEIPLENKPTQSALLNAVCHIPDSLTDKCSVKISHLQFTESQYSHMLSEMIVNVVWGSWIYIRCVTEAFNRDVINCFFYFFREYVLQRNIDFFKSIVGSYTKNCSKCISVFQRFNSFQINHIATNKYIFWGRDFLMKERLVLSLNDTPNTKN
jgi:hypothetical protein